MGQREYCSKRTNVSYVKSIKIATQRTGEPRFRPFYHKIALYGSWDNILNSYRTKSLIAMAILCFGYGLITYAIVFTEMQLPHSDFTAHVAGILDIWMTDGFRAFFHEIPYPGWHAIVFLLISLGVSSNVSACLACSLFAFVTAGFVYLTCSYIIEEQSRIMYILAASLVILFATAIYVPFFNVRVYIGQGSPTIWHNPTYFAIRPIALLTYLLFFKMVKNDDSSFKPCCQLALLTLLGLFMKPSFYQIQLPGMAVYLLFKAIVDRDLRFTRNVSLAFMPSFAYMALEAIVLFGTSKNAGGIIIAPFAILAGSSPCLPISLLLLLAFPMYALIVLRKDIFTKNSPFLPIIITFVVGFFEVAFLAEGGDRMSDGNFAWGYCLGLFLLWAFTIPLFFKRSFVTRELPIVIVVIGCMLMTLHLVSGIVYCHQFLSGFLMSNGWQC